jgi:hypothetical protein
VVQRRGDPACNPQRLVERQLRLSLEALAEVSPLDVWRDAIEDLVAGGPTAPSRIEDW